MNFYSYFRKYNPLFYFSNESKRSVSWDNILKNIYQWIVFLFTQSTIVNVHANAANKRTDKREIARSVYNFSLSQRADRRFPESVRTIILLYFRRNRSSAYDLQYSRTPIGCHGSPKEYQKTAAKAEESASRQGVQLSVLPTREVLRGDDVSTSWR